MEEGGEALEHEGGEEPDGGALEGGEGDDGFVVVFPGGLGGEHAVESGKKGEEGEDLDDEGGEFCAGEIGGGFGGAILIADLGDEVFEGFFHAGRSDGDGLGEGGLEALNEFFDEGVFVNGGGGGLGRFGRCRGVGDGGLSDEGGFVSDGTGGSGGGGKHLGGGIGAVAGGGDGDGGGGLIFSFAGNDASGVGEGFDDEIGGDFEAGGIGVGGFAVGIAQENGACAGGGAGGDVARLIADRPALREVEAEIGGGLFEHAGLGLAPIVIDFVFDDGGLGVVGAVVGGVDVGAGVFAELAAHFLVDGFDGVFIEHAAGDAGLVGDDDEAVAQRADGGEGGGGAGEEFYFGGIAEVAIIVDDGVVAVEKYGTFGHEERVL